MVVGFFVVHIVWLTAADPLARERLSRTRLIIIGFSIISCSLLAQAVCVQVAAQHVSLVYQRWSCFILRNWAQISLLFSSWLIIIIFRLLNKSHTFTLTPGPTLISINIFIIIIIEGHIEIELTFQDIQVGIQPRVHQYDGVIDVILWIVIVSITQLLCQFQLLCWLSSMPLRLRGLSVVLSVKWINLLLKVDAWVIELTIAWNLLSSHELPVALLWFEYLLVALLQSMVLLLYQLLSEFGFLFLFAGEVIMIWFWHTLDSAVVIIFSKLNLGWVLGDDASELHSAGAALALSENAGLDVAKWLSVVIWWFVIVGVALERMLWRILMNIFLLCLALRPKSFNISHGTALYPAILCMRVWFLHHFGVNTSSYYWLRTPVIQKTLLIVSKKQRIRKFTISASMFLLGFDISLLRQTIFEPTREELFSAVIAVCWSSISTF